ncbi:RNA polymerase sigma-70 factor (ECF subfamily) [Rhodobacter aestuarii]|uniref:RNA polymerase sigma factor n=1 Tax=Rhodobacter aestuarii TaxID=453582 RepID=A0A1N7M0Q6_9RHOB|nr:MULTISPECIES: RNA polymerase sigma factor [Rhodobacter]PTV94765.1 RNA polymerase sigma-70 factor (ECF subfamily) [Rhodobacter aestuarii]SIS79668.1 RNA polymerase sigma-70 factor, ECF subfamily [Rhodobacter aestuarii]SOC14505.1 RNA polymerase sigma-70 factor [Rhodobacter sp. JA431]
MSGSAKVPADPRDELATHIPALRAFAISLTRNTSEADDLVQEAILKAWSNFDKFQVGTDMKAWLFTILRNTFYSARRKTRREVADPDGIHAGSLSVRPAHDGRLALADFTRAFDQLSDEHREVLILVGANGYSYEQAAGMMGCAVGTAKSRANRARARLGELLGLEEGEDLLSSPATFQAVAGPNGPQAA